MENILKYQEIDKKLREIDIALANSDERKKASMLKQYLTNSEENAQNFEKRAEDLIAKYQKVSSSFEQCKKEISEYEKQDGTAETNLEELKYLEKKVGQLFDLLKQLESELQSIVSEMDSVSKAFAEMRKKFAHSKEEFSVYKKKYEDLKESKNIEIAAIQAELKSAEKGIKKEILAIYKKKKADKIFPVFVLLNGDYCGGCSTEIPLNQKNNLQTQDYIECENCRRLMCKK